MKLLFPAVFIGLVGGMLDEYTDLSKIWCFLIGVGAFGLYVLTKSLFITIKIMRQAKGKKRFRMDADNNVIKSE